MARRHVYLLTSVLSAAAFAVMVVVANNFYWGASQHAGGYYYLFRRPLPYPLGPLLWAGVKPLLLATPVLTAWVVYLTMRSWRADRGPRACRKCGYNLTGNVSGVCPECGTSASLKGGSGRDGA